MRQRNPIAVAFVGASIILAAPAAAQETAEDVTSERRGPPEGMSTETVFDGDWASIGIGVAYSPSYDGSDDYVLSPAPLIQGSVGGIDINARPAGLAVDFIGDSATGASFDAGLAFRIRSNRASRIKDDVVKLAGELDTAIEVGPTVGASIPRVLNPFDSLSAAVDVRWDVAGAHGGMVVDPSITYFTPLSRGMAASLSLSAEYATDDYADYYFSVDAQQSADSGLAEYQADGGFNKVGANLLFAVDLDGDITNGGFAAVLIGGYSRLIGDAKRTPYTSERGSADQLFSAFGIGYAF
ncbi:MipA/OmpV family protein [Altererythrobacter sp. ZODW24]|uniref:MipA/OmpV family protein n=1 Tax=Altererythrobacter sp. ZODW24 TaxID=2185142 RepID=UPI000DF7A06B|nr:MipA/OmpV family protein [Altererythrobacter sp. ZODW24]